MLTRLEVNGFKNLLDFSVDFGPFNCIAGPNGVGKSNIFDVIRFLSLLAELPLMEAALQIRGTDTETAELLDIFWGANVIPPEQLKIHIATEMIVPRRITDDFGRKVEATSSFLRYEIEIGYAPPDSRGAFLGRLVLLSESLNHIKKEEAVSKLKFPHSKKEFRDAIVHNARRGSGFISTNQRDDGTVEIQVHQDGGASGRPNKIPANNTPRTVIASANSSETPTILAARREMQSWSILALEPTAMRGASRFQTDPHVTSQGGHLPATLYRMANADLNDHQRVYARVASLLADLVPINQLQIDVDDIRKLLTLRVKERSGTTVPARSLSDGTLRFLALAVLSEDPETQGLICMEEPENGIHPAKIPAMVDLLKAIAVDPNLPPDIDNPLRQVIIATHSPLLVEHVGKDSVLFAKEFKVKHQNIQTRALQLQPLQDTWRTHDRQGISVHTEDVKVYLTAPEGTQLKFLQG